MEQNLLFQLWNILSQIKKLSTSGIFALGANIPNFESYITHIIHHFQYYHVFLMKHGKLFQLDVHIIQSEWHNTKLAFR